MSTDLSQSRWPIAGFPPDPRDEEAQGRCCEEHLKHTGHLPAEVAQVRPPRMLRLSGACVTGRSRSQIWCHTPVILVHRRWRQEDFEFEASLGYRIRPRLKKKDKGGKKPNLVQEDSCHTCCSRERKAFQAGGGDWKRQVAYKPRRLNQPLLTEMTEPAGTHRGIWGL
jgi:hypothetical protein